MNLHIADRSSLRDNPNPSGRRRPRLRLLALAAILMAIPAGGGLQSARADNPRPARRWAVLVGVDQYASAQRLNYCGADMLALRQRLLSAGFAPGRLFLLHNGATEPKYLPSKTNIELTLDLVLRAADPNDVVLLAFSGHGVHLDGTSYLCPFDSHLDDPSTLVSLNDIYARFQNCPAAFKLAMIDACRNDPRLGGVRGPQGTDITAGFARSLEKSPEGILIMSSCRAGETSTEDENLAGGHGVFMNFVIEALEGSADDDQNGRITLGELAMYAGDRTTEYVLDKFSRVQKPSLLGDIPIKALNFELTERLAATGITPATPSLADGSVDQSRPFVNSMGMQLVLIPAGEFVMGSPDSEHLRSEDEGPQHTVRITRPFYLGVYEVTRQEFAQFAEAVELKPTRGWGYNAQQRNMVIDEQASWRSWGVKQSDSSPVVNVSWEDCHGFCQWLSEKEGRKYRLPTEAEWEYACRAGTTTPYYSGDRSADLFRAGNTADASTKLYLPKTTWTAGLDDGWPFTSPVGRFAPNSFGLYDMYGNAAEWCADWYDETYYARSPADDPQGPLTGTKRVVRGGSWYDFGESGSRSAARNNFGPTSAWYDIGFRVVCEQPEN